MKSENVGAAAQVLARGCGVRAGRSILLWVQPLSGMVGRPHMPFVKSRVGSGMMLRSRASRAYGNKMTAEHIAIEGRQRVSRRGEAEGLPSLRCCPSRGR